MDDWDFANESLGLFSSRLQLADASARHRPWRPDRSTITQSAEPGGSRLVLPLLPVDRFLRGPIAEGPPDLVPTSLLFGSVTKSLSHSLY